MKSYTSNNVNLNFLSLLFIASFLVIASCSDKANDPAVTKSIEESYDEDLYQLSAKQFTSSNMELGALQTINFHEMVKANGYFDVPPEYKASIGTYFGGTVLDLKLLPGDEVKKGQTLFTLENPDFVKLQQDYLEIKSALVYLKSDYDRQSNLVKDNVTSQKNYLKAQSDFKSSQVKLKSIEKSLLLMNIDPNLLTVDNIATKISIKSPLNGYITQINTQNGAYLTPSQAALSIINTDHLHLELSIFEKDLAKVKEDQMVEFFVQGFENKFEAIIKLVNKTVDLENRTVNVHAHLTNENIANLFTPGMYLESNILTTSTPKASLPQDALVEIDNKYYALLLTNSTTDSYSFIKKEMKIGTTTNDRIEILNVAEFNDNSQFLTKGTFNILAD